MAPPKVPTRAHLLCIALATASLCAFAQEPRWLKHYGNGAAVYGFPLAYDGAQHLYGVSISIGNETHMEQGSEIHITTGETWVSCGDASFNLNGLDSRPSQSALTKLNDRFCRVELLFIYPFFQPLKYFQFHLTRI
jgi:hypothetical protein